MFLRKAVAGGHTEVTLAILAQQKSASEPVKQLARRIQKDHEKANAELQAIADKKNVSVDHKTTADQAKLKARLEPLSGAAFDRAYLEAMVEDHQKDTKEFEKQASAGTDPELKAFASRTLPDLQDHLKLATDAQRTVTSSAQR